MHTYRRTRTARAAATPNHLLTRLLDRRFASASIAQTDKVLEDLLGQPCSEVESRDLAAYFQLHYGAQVGQVQRWCVRVPTVS